MSSIYREDKVVGQVVTSFLAGGMAGDNKIKIYDLSAVASYFGTENPVSDRRLRTKSGDRQNLSYNKDI